MFESPAIRFGSQKSLLIECCFFATPVFTETFSWNLTRLWQPITLVLNLQISKTTTFSESSGRQLSHGTPLYRSYLFKILSNLHFSSSSFGVFLAFSAQSSRRCLVKSLKLAVWAFSLNFFPDFVLTLEADNYGLKAPIFKNYHIFGNLWTSAFTWCHTR